MYTLPPIHERSVKRRNEINEVGENISGGNFLGVNFPGKFSRAECDGWELSKGDFPGENFPRIISLIW